MELRQEIAKILPRPLVAVLEVCVKTEDFSELEAFIRSATERDEHMKPASPDEKKTKYYKAFVQTVVPKILPAYVACLKTGNWPEIEVTFAEADVTRKTLGLPTFGSPQDFLYGFTSDRYSEWGATLEATGFRSACMSGQGSMTVNVADRFLTLEKPDIETEELEGAIDREFFESVKVLFSAPTSGSRLNSVLSSLNPELLTEFHQKRDGETLRKIKEFLENPKDTFNISDKWHSDAALLDVKKAYANGTGKLKPAVLQKLLEVQMLMDEEKQEQIALKYMEEGKYLQKLFGGQRFDHVQSNVKMVANPMRKNKCEVDSIYRASGKKRIILVEAKAKLRVSRAQLYQIYETYRLKVPLDWEVDVVALTRSDANPGDSAKGFTTQIDVVHVGFDKKSFGKITESLLGVFPKKHYRWKIKKVS